jgi:hypothetical protein
MGMPSAGRIVTRSFGVGLKSGCDVACMDGSKVAKIAAASRSAKPMPMQIRGPALNGK